MKHVKILLVEDNDGDIVLTKEAFLEAKLLNEIAVAKDGEQALDYLYRRDHYEHDNNWILPDLILLDINLPKISGLEVLSEIKQHQHLKIIPVIMLTTSQSEKDILASYQHYANCYITKPVDLGKFLEVVRTIENFWISIVKLPHADNR
jgi:two-component system, chemotaxis family, response regulator Rcp1